MSSSASTVAAASVPISVLIGIYWAGTVLSLTVLLLRLYIRRTVLGQFKADDYLVAAAWICFCAVSITWSILGKDLYAAIDADTSSLTTVSRLVSYLKEYAQALHANLGTYFSTWTSLYLVKLSFMVFFRGLGNKIKTQTILWWCVLAFIIASYAVSVGMFDYGCLTADWAHIIEKCTGTGVLNYEYATTRVSTTLDVVTDALIMVIPGNIVWKARIPLKKKLALVGICSLTAFMMICAIIRIGVGTIGKSTDLSWFLLWNAVEMTLAIIVACIASFRSLYTKAKTTRKTQQSPRYEMGLEQMPAKKAVSKTQTTIGMDTLCEGEHSLWVNHSIQNSEEFLWEPSKNYGIQKTTQTSVSYES